MKGCIVTIFRPGITRSGHRFVHGVDLFNGSRYMRTYSSDGGERVMDLGRIMYGKTWCGQPITTWDKEFARFMIADQWTAA